MSIPECVQRDERTVAIENASYRWAYLVVAYALLVDVMYRAIIHREAAWDLMTLVIVGGVVCTIYQARQQILTRGWVMKVVLAACIAGVIAAVMALTL
jgi:hypothetical protein